MTQAARDPELEQARQLASVFTPADVDRAALVLRDRAAKLHAEAVQLEAEAAQLEAGSVKLKDDKAGTQLALDGG